MLIIQFLLVAVLSVKHRQKPQYQTILKFHVPNKFSQPQTFRFKQKEAKKQDMYETENSYLQADQHPKLDRLAIDIEKNHEYQNLLNENINRDEIINLKNEIQLQNKDIKNLEISLRNSQESQKKFQEEFEGFVQGHIQTETEFDNEVKANFNQLNSISQTINQKQNSQDKDMNEHFQQLSGLLASPKPSQQSNSEEYEFQSFVTPSIPKKEQEQQQVKQDIKHEQFLPVKDLLKDKDSSINIQEEIEQIKDNLYSKINKDSKPKFIVPKMTKNQSAVEAEALPSKNEIYYRGRMDNKVQYNEFYNDYTKDVKFEPVQFQY